MSARPDKGLEVRGMSYVAVKQINDQHGHELLIPPIYRTIVSARQITDGNQHYQEFIIAALSNSVLNRDEIASRPQALKGAPIEYFTRFKALGGFIQRP